MTDDLLKRSTDALRKETALPELRSGLTRARLLDNAAKAQKKRGNPLRWIAPFVLTLGAGTALAHVTHQYFPEVWNAVVPEALERSVPEEEVVRRAQKPKKKAITAPAPVAPVPAPPPVIETPVVPEPELAVVQPEAPKPARGKRAHAPAIAQPAEPEPPVLAITPKPEAPAESAELSLFRRAQRLHTAKDKGAIAAWDDFLRVAPKSPLATEARYNRALGLIRAGRSDDARKALAPFARGDMGGYRQREAAELIDALNDRDAGVR
jgi:hypothetical protein